MRLAIEPVKRLIEDLKAVPAKRFCNAKAARKRWLVTQEDRDLYQQAITARLIADFEKQRVLQYGMYDYVTLGKRKRRDS